LELEHRQKRKRKKIFERIAQVEELLQRRPIANRSRLEYINKMKEYVKKMSWLSSSYSAMLTRWKKENERLQKKKNNAG